MIGRIVGVNVATEPEIGINKLICVLSRYVLMDESVFNYSLIPQIKCNPKNAKGNVSRSKAKVGAVTINTLPY